MISVIICTYNRDKYIYNVLKSLALGTLEHSAYEIILVDNNCTDNTRSEVDHFCNVFPQVTLRYFVETNQGLSHARNRGIRESKGDILVYVDDDATVNPDYLKTYADWFESHPETDAAGGPIIPHYETGSEPKWMTYFIKRLLTGYLYFGDKAKPFPGQNYPGGGNAAYRSRVFEKVGLYNVELGRNGDSLGGGEEKDIFDKMKREGMQFVYLPQAILYHSIPGYKLEADYFNRLTAGIGQSERARTLRIGKSSYRKRLLSELKKWCATIVLWCFYLITFRPGRGNMLIRFRRNVTKALLGK
ncbi:MAG: glycosyltransferase [Bacteroidaceae bacterium]|nr:glycosyltransferase [Bacteroidaceae bacterium]MBR6857164.1 glycosyltransferase [Bacteroidaceae bacterium]